MPNSLGVNFNFGKAHWSDEGFEKFRERLGVIVGLNYQALATNVREAGCPTPPYKEPLMYLLYASTVNGEIPWRQCLKLGERLLFVSLPWGEADADRIQVLLLHSGLEEAVRLHLPLSFR